MSQGGMRWAEVLVRASRVRHQKILLAPGTDLPERDSESGR